jgi:O-antigen/teichoic acid export membrane protein
MGGIHPLRTRLISALRQRGDIAGAVVTGYLQMAVSIAVNLLLVPLYLRSLGTGGFGLLMMLIGLNAWAGIATFWLVGGATRRLGVTYAHGRWEEFALAWAAAKWGILGGTILVAASISGVVWLMPSLFGPEAARSDDFSLAMIFFYLQFAAAWLYGIDRLAMTVSGHQTLANLLLVGQQLLLGILVFLALRLDGGLSSVMAAFFGSHAAALVASAICRRAYLGRFSWRSPFDPAVRGELVSMLSRQGAAFQVFGVLMLSLQADILIVGLIGGPLIAAEFALVWKIAEVLIQALWRIPDTLQPRMIHLDAKRETTLLKTLLRRVDWALLCLAAAAGIAYALLGRWIIGLWVGAEHAPADMWVYVLAGGAIFWLTISRLPISAAYGTGRLRRLLQLGSIELLGKVLGTAALIGAYGLLAPLMAINIVHALGVACGYRGVLRGISEPEPRHAGG